MLHSFFPDPVFGWIFYGMLMVFLAVASYTDLRWITIPKWLTLPMLGSGIAFNLARGLWLGSNGLAVWHWQEPGVALGGLDGLLFALEGFLLSLAVFIGMYVLGTAAGGDVKLFAALGAWLGPTPLLFLVFVGTGVIIGVISFGQIIQKLFRRGVQRTVFGITRKTQASTEASRRGPGGKKLVRGRHLTYSLPVALSAALILLWSFRVDLHLMPPGSEGAPASRIQAQQP